VEAVKGALSFRRGTGTDDRGLWGVTGLWQQFLEQVGPLYLKLRLRGIGLEGVELGGEGL
jgi:hypothetical protein